MTIKFTDAMSFEDVAKAISLLNKRATTLKNDVQRCLIAVALRWHETGDATRATTLYTRIVNEVEGYYGQAIVNYLSSYLKLEWKQGSKEKPGSFRYTETKASKETILAMKKEAFFDFSPPPVPKPFDLTAEVEKLIMKAQKKAKDGQEGDVVPLSLIRKLTAAVSDWKVEQQQTA